MSRTVQGASIKLYINGRLYPEVQELSYDIEYGENEIYGIDSPFPQEIATTRISVGGSVRGIKIRLSGGIHGYDMRPQIVDALSSPYISIRIYDRAAREDILYIPNAKVVAQAVSIPSKGMMKIDFKFKGLIPYETLDRG